MAKNTQRSRFIHGLQTFVLLILIAWLLSSLNFRELGKVLSDINISWLAVPILLHLGAVWLNAYRWMALLRDNSIPLWRLAYSQIVGQFFNVFLPSDMGGDVYKMHDIHKFCKSGSKSVVSVLLTRVFGFLAMGVILTMGLIVSHHIIRSQSVFWVALIYSGFSITAIIVLIERRLPALLSEKTDFKDKIKNKYVLKLVSMLDEFNQIMINRKIVLFTLFLGVMFQALLIVIIFFYGLTLDVTLSFGSLFLVAPLIMLISALPLSINSLGLREGAFVYFLNWLGLTNEQGIIIALLSRSVSGIIIPLLGGMLFILFRRHIDKLLPANQKVS
ncbi:lysylphosphatidylglycerol synthase transmembrane domain-containing protein [Desulfonema magnum]|nr:lysylphosphatidylglycerol synthase transmembrane domain-containing protein [Desulfonema magnum]